MFHDIPPIILDRMKFLEAADARDRLDGTHRIERLRQIPPEIWDHYPIYYGDGVYTRGEFLHLNKVAIVRFLRQAYARGQSLKARPYYFGSRCYVLTDLDEKPAQ